MLRSMPHPQDDVEDPQRRHVNRELGYFALSVEIHGEFAFLIAELIVKPNPLVNALGRPQYALHHAVPDGDEARAFSSQQLACRDPSNVCLISKFRPRNIRLGTVHHMLA
jgi:hypothetical protein